MYNYEIDTTGEQKMKNAFNIAKELGTSISQKVKGIDHQLLHPFILRTKKISAF